MNISLFMLRVILYTFANLLTILIDMVILISLLWVGKCAHVHVTGSMNAWMLYAENRSELIVFAGDSKHSLCPLDLKHQLFRVGSRWLQLQ